MENHRDKSVYDEKSGICCCCFCSSTSFRRIISLFRCFSVPFIDSKIYSPTSVNFTLLHILLQSNFLTFLEVVILLLHVCVKSITDCCSHVCCNTCNLIEKKTEKYTAAATLSLSESHPLLTHGHCLAN
jgi:hypothetical protein